MPSTIHPDPPSDLALGSVAVPNDMRALLDAFARLQDPQARRRVIAAAQAEAARAGAEVVVVGMRRRAGA